MRYSIHGIPAAIHQAIRDHAKAEGKSLNELAIEILAKGLRVSAKGFKRRDFSDIAGTWKKNANCEKVISCQDKVDQSSWK